jgi:hypothetical protein
VDTLFPWAAVLFAVAVGTFCAISAYMLWHQRGLRRWYSRRGSSAAVAVRRLSGSGMIPASALFFSLAASGTFGYLTKHASAPGLAILFAMCEGAIVVVLALSITLMFSIFFVGKPESLIPPALRRDRTD